MGSGYGYEKYQCLPDDAMGCGCAIRISTIACEGSSVDGYHLFTELYDGAPLKMQLEGKLIEIPSQRLRDSGFSGGSGNVWSESYSSDDWTVRIDYKPGQSTCGKSSHEHCEYFDVNTRIVIERGGVKSTYHGSGVCGC